VDAADVAEMTAEAALADSEAAALVAEAPVETFEGTLNVTGIAAKKGREFGFKW
jgi:hypothetical protein